MWRGPPEPSTGLLPCTSGVAQAQPNWLAAPGSNPPEFAAGTAKSARLSVLKNSARNCAEYRSLNFHSLPTERSEEHTSELQSQFHLVCRLLLEKKNKKKYHNT